MGRLRLSCRTEETKKRKQHETYCVCFGGIDASPPPPVKGEWFDQGKAAFSTGKRWQKAAIKIEDGKIEVYRRKDKQLVAEFDQSATLAFDIHSRNRGMEAGIVLLTGGAILGGAYAAAKAQEGEYVFREDGRHGVRTISGKRVGIVAAVIVGIAAAVGLTKLRMPYVEVSDGMKKINLRVNKDDHARFGSVLEDFTSYE